MDYVYDKAAFWMYVRRQRLRARPFVTRLKRLLDASSESGDNIPSVEAKALIADFEEDLTAELAYTRLKIMLLRRLLGQETSVGRYDRSDVLKEMEILCLLLEEAGKRNQAIRMVDECKAFAQRFDLRFNEGKLRREIWKAT